MLKKYNVFLTKTNIKTNYFWFAFICAFSVAHIYYNQPILSLISKDLDINPNKIGIIPFIIQISYAFGLIFFVPLGDFLSRKKVLISLLIINSLASFIISFSQNLIQLIIFNIFIGLTSVGAQIVIPMVSLIAMTHEKGKAVGLVTSGLMTGVLLGRILSGFIGEIFSWNTVYRFSAILDILLIFILLRVIPITPISTNFSYLKTLKSLFSYFFNQKELRYICLSGGLLFTAVSSLWGALAFLLAHEPYHYGSDTVGSLGLTGIAGILITPYIGQLVDRLQPKAVIILASIFCIIGFCLIGFAQISLIFLICGLTILDIGARANLVGNQLKTFNLSTEARSRLNTIFMFCYFIGGALGTWLGSIISYKYSWLGMAIFGLSLGCVNLVINLARHIKE
ncbi:MAG: MFS transporter [Acinetobacter sp.]